MANAAAKKLALGKCNVVTVVFHYDIIPCYHATYICVYLYYLYLSFVNVFIIP